jgi:hypothetical protein
MKLIFNIWWLYVSLIYIIVLDTFEVVLRISISFVKELFTPLIVIWEYG